MHGEVNALPACMHATLWHAGTDTCTVTIHGSCIMDGSVCVWVSQINACTAFTLVCRATHEC